MMYKHHNIHNNVSYLILQLEEDYVIIPNIIVIVQVKLVLVVPIEEIGKSVSKI